APLTLSVMPRQTHTGWIAEEGHRRGYDIIGHIPMEAKESHALGSGGLYTWMTEDEIRETLEGDFVSIHYARGISNHMGSAFTEDDRAVRILLSVLKEHGFFFLDSLTTSKSAGVRLAKEQGVKILKRDIFLDYNDSPSDIKTEWDKLIAIAQKNGYAIALAHPKKNTIEFLRKTLPSNKVTVVPISKLAGD
ncbi:MAG: divergent polysaccharide deacetylase family protein, partial [Nitrospirota bacterium]